MKHRKPQCLFRRVPFALLLLPLVQTAGASDPPAFSVAALLFDDRALDRPHDVEIQGNLAFVPGKGGSIAVIDVADPTKPKVLWHDYDPRRLDDAETVLPLGSHLLLGTNDFIVLDIANPRAPVVRAVVSDRTRIGRINGMAKRGDYVFAANKNGWVNVFDIRDLEKPRLFASLNVRKQHGLSSPHDLDVSGDHLVVVDPAGFGRRGLPGKVGVYRVADPVSHELLPAEAWKLEGVLENHDLVGVNRVQIAGRYAYVSGSRADGPSNTVVVDIRDPSRPCQVAALRFSDKRGPNGLTLVGDVLFVAGGQTVEAIDVSDPTQPRRLASYRCLDAFAAGRDSAHDLVYRDGYLFVTAQNDNCFCILKVNDRRIRKLARKVDR